ncbi:hypothetical protein B0H13DRAFT_1885620 [Mycena leptocephala]|nr:hypothetical protein B0H13DRAFT_1885620 [Mycena leptocephala]
MTTPSMPSRGDRNAPTFDSAKPRELPRYFSDLEYHFTRCNVTDDAQKKPHATRFLTVCDQDAWESLTEFTTPTTSYADFKAAVLKLYPGTDADRKYSLADLDTLVGTHTRTGIHSKGDFSEIYRDFSAISTYLINKGRLSTSEQSRSFRRAMQPASLWERVHQRLQIKKPDVHPDDPYALADLKEAADFVLEGTSIAATSSDVTSPAQPKQEAEMAVLINSVTKLVDVLAQSTLGRRMHAIRTKVTHPVIIPIPIPVSTIAYIQAGLCKRDINGKVVLPSGAFVPRHIQGRNLRECMQEYHRLNPEQMAAPQMMLDTHQNFAYMQNSNSLSIEDRQKNLAEEFEALENMRQAQYIQTRAQAPVVPAEAEVLAPRAPEHPYAKARDAAYAAPKGRNFGVKPPPMPPVKRHGPAYRSAPPVVDNKIVSNVFDRSMEAPITLTQRELLSLAPDVRSQYKDVTTSRRIATEAPPMTTEQQFLNAVDEDLPFGAEPIAGLDEPSSRNTDHAFATFTASMPVAYEQTLNRELPPNALIAQDKFATLYDAEITPESGRRGLLRHPSSPTHRG